MVSRKHLLFHKGAQGPVDFSDAPAETKCILRSAADCLKRPAAGGEFRKEDSILLPRILGDSCHCHIDLRDFIPGGKVYNTVRC